MNGWFNVYGLIIIVVMMIPNILFAFKHKEGFTNRWQNKTIEILEWIGRFGCFAFMVINIPYTWMAFWFEGAFTAYLAVNGLLLAGYLIIWALFFSKNGVFRSLALSILPACMFLFSAIMLRSIPLMISAVIFAPSHILISYKNALR